LHSKVVIITSIILILVGAFGFFVLEKNNSMEGYSSGTKVLASFFQSVSARTAGFNTVDLSKISTTTIILLSFLMFIGASPGGTGGGIKTTTFAILVLWVVSAIKNKESTEVLNRRINPETLQKALLMFFLSVITIILATFILSIFETFSLQKIVFEVCSAFGTVGLTTGITPYLTLGSKITLALLMFIGRMTPLALLSLISKRTRDKIRFPEEQVAVG
jgi:trk system potassium uptake protein TrkH